MSDPNTIDPEYNEFLKVFDGCWPTNYEFFLAACNWQKQKQKKAQGEPVGVVKRNGLGFPCVDLLGKNGAQYFGLEEGTKLYTDSREGAQCIGYVTGHERFITDAPKHDHSQPVFVIPRPFVSPKQKESE